MTFPFRFTWNKKAQPSAQKMSTYFAKEDMAQQWVSRYFREEGDEKQWASFFLAELATLGYLADAVVASPGPYFKNVLEKSGEDLIQETLQQPALFPIRQLRKGASHDAVLLVLFWPKYTTGVVLGFGQRETLIQTLDVHDFGGHQPFGRRQLDLSHGAMALPYYPFPALLTDMPTPMDTGTGAGAPATDDDGDDTVAVKPRPFWALYLHYPADCLVPVPALEMLVEWRVHVLSHFATAIKDGGIMPPHLFLPWHEAYFSKPEGCPAHVHFVDIMPNVTERMYLIDTLSRFLLALAASTVGSHGLGRRIEHLEAVFLMHRLRFCYPYGVGLPEAMDHASHYWPLFRPNDICLQTPPTFYRQRASPWMIKEPTYLLSKDTELYQRIQRDRITVNELKTLVFTSLCTRVPVDPPIEILERRQMLSKDPVHWDAHEIDALVASMGDERATAYFELPWKSVSVLLSGRQLILKRGMATVARRDLYHAVIKHVNKIMNLTRHTVYDHEHAHTTMPVDMIHRMEICGVLGDLITEQDLSMEDLNGVFSRVMDLNPARYQGQAGKHIMRMQTLPDIEDTVSFGSGAPLCALGLAEKLRDNSHLHYQERFVLFSSLLKMGAENEALREYVTVHLQQNTTKMTGYLMDLTNLIKNHDRSVQSEGTVRDIGYGCDGLKSLQVDGNNYRAKCPFAHAAEDAHGKRALIQLLEKDGVTADHMHKILQGLETSPGEACRLHAVLRHGVHEKHEIFKSPQSFLFQTRKAKRKQK